MISIPANIMGKNITVSTEPVLVDGDGNIHYLQEQYHDYAAWLHNRICASFGVDIANGPDRYAYAAFLAVQDGNASSAPYTPYFDHTDEQWKLLPVPYTPQTPQKESPTMAFTSPNESVLQRLTEMAKSRPITELLGTYRPAKLIPMLITRDVKITHEQTEWNWGHRTTMTVTVEIIQGTEKPVIVKQEDLNVRLADGIGKVLWGADYPERAASNSPEQPEAIPETNPEIKWKKTPPARPKRQQFDNEGGFNRAMREYVEELEALAAKANEFAAQAAAAQKAAETAHRKIDGIYQQLGQLNLKLQQDTKDAANVRARLNSAETSNQTLRSEARSAQLEIQRLKDQGFAGDLTQIAQGALVSHMLRMAQEFVRRQPTSAEGISLLTRARALAGQSGARIQHRRFRLHEIEAA